MLKKSLKDFYPTSESNGYGIEIAFKRFEILKDFSFQTILDVGSGPCLLHQWLIKNNINVEYEAVDIRNDSLSLCHCKTHTQIPKDKFYDLVCLFGTVTFNIDHNESLNKNILKNLVDNSINICSKYIILTVFKEKFKKKLPKNIQKLCVSFSEEEIKLIFLHPRIQEINIYEKNDLDRDEYFVIAKVD